MMKLPSLSLAFFALKSISSDSNSSFLLVTISFPLLIDLVFIFNAYRHHIAVSCFFILSETSTSSFGIFRLFIFSTIIGKFRTKSILLLFFLQFPFRNCLYLSLAVLGPGDCGCCSRRGHAGGHPPAAGCGPLLLWSAGCRRPGWKELHSSLFVSFLFLCLFWINSVFLKDSIFPPLLACLLKGFVVNIFKLTVSIQVILYHLTYKMEFLNRILFLPCS